MIEMKRINSLWPQWLSTLAVTVSLLQIGCICTWSSPYIPKLTSKNSTLPMTLNEASWIASIMNVGRTLGAVFGGGSVYIFGSKTSLLITCLPTAACWILTALAQSIVWLFLGRVLAGIGMGMAFSCFPLYIGEIADPRIRGSLISAAMIGIPTGSLLTSIIGAHLDLETSSIIFLVLSLIAIVMFLCLPESPHHLMRGDVQRVKAAIAWYDRGCDVDRVYSSLKTYVETSNSQGFLEKTREFKRVELRKALYIVLMLFMYMQMSGLTTIVFYMEMILRDAKSTIIDPSMTVIMVSAVTVIAIGISTYLIELLGRRGLLIVSSVGTAIGLAVLEIHFTFLDNGHDPIKLQALPIASLVIFQLSAFTGMMTVPSTVLSEIFPPAIKCVAACAASVVGALFAFITTKTFQPLVDVIGQKWKRG
ncbi:facilitated trehalose transporter Tret1 isoform X2 [Fopius arisanus]|uniref:Facilitated trehalose transporter Tret1 isoform X2 n=1 Tax=Fopius arisanus TaxID=64838 RepID=A0A9R1U1P3_9HYME|nr:PREDICTED: facilitated trehalose transporter Tret1-like isoform X2 [Fopius arisanus]